jgi:hypothetical protein
MDAIIENPNKRELKNNNQMEYIGEEFEIEVGDGIDAKGGNVGIKQGVENIKENAEEVVKEAVEDVKKTVKEQKNETSEKDEVDKDSLSEDTKEDSVHETEENTNKNSAQEVAEETTENAELEVEEKKDEFLELCAAAVISIDENQQVIVYNQALRPHSANKDVSERLHITQTNAFVDAKDIQDLHKIAQQVSLNGIDPFSSTFALKEMFERAVEEGLIPIEEAPDLTKNIIIGNIVYFKNGAIEELNLEIITLEVGQIESILEAENPEQLKEMINEIENLRPKDARPMDGPTQEATGRHAQDMGKDDVGMDIGTR